MHRPPRQCTSTSLKEPFPRRKSGSATPAPSGTKRSATAANPAPSRSMDRTDPLFRQLMLLGRVVTGSTLSQKVCSTSRFATQFFVEGSIAPSSYDLYDGAQYRQYIKEQAMGGSPGRWTKITAGTDDAGSRRRWNQKAGPAAVLVVVVLTMAACSSGTDTNLQTAPPKPNPLTPANPNLPAGTASTQH